MRDEPESYLELALKFKANGDAATARKLLEAIDAKTAYPTVKLHLGKVHAFLALPVGYCNPFRKETKDLLEQLVADLSVAGRPAGLARAYYYLGNVYGNVDTAKAMSAWAKCGDDAYALRNLGYGHWKWTVKVSRRATRSSRPRPAPFRGEIPSRARPSPPSPPTSPRTVPRRNRTE